MKRYGKTSKKHHTTTKKKSLTLYWPLDRIKKEVKDYTLLVISSFILTFSYDYFIANTTKYGLFPAGVGALSRISAIYTSDDLSKQNLFYFIYLFLYNLPLFIFSIVKLSVKFSIKTILFIVLQSVFNLIIMATPINPEKFHILMDYKALQENTDIHSITYQLWLFAFAVLGGTSYGYACGLVYSVNGSTGGTDFITMYFSVKKKKSIGNLNRYTNFVILGVVMLLQAFHISNAEYHTIFHLDAGENWSRGKYIASYIFGPSLFASLLMIFIVSAMINLTYPKYQYRTLFIITKKSDAVVKSMRKVGTVINDISLWDVVNTQLDEKEDTKGYKIIMSTITLIEYQKVKKSIITVDPGARVFLQKVDRIAGTYRIRDNL